MIRAIRYGRTDVQYDPKRRKASLSKKLLLCCRESRTTGLRIQTMEYLWHLLTQTTNKIIDSKLLRATFS